MDADYFCIKCNISISDDEKNCVLLFSLLKAKQRRKSKKRKKTDLGILYHKVKGLDRRRECIFKTDSGITESLLL